MQENDGGSQIGGKEMLFEETIRYEDHDGFFDEDYFQNHEFKFDSLMNHSGDHNESAVE